MVKAAKLTNLTVAFLLELGVLVALGYWGFHTGQGTITHLGLGIGAPLVAVGVWAVFGAPRSERRLQGFGLLMLRIVFFGSGIVALFAAGQSTFGVAFALIFSINLALIYLWKQ